MHRLILGFSLLASANVQLPVQYQAGLFHDASVSGPGIAIDADADGDLDWLHSERGQPLRSQRNLGHGLVAMATKTSHGRKSEVSKKRWMPCDPAR